MERTKRTMDCNSGVESQLNRLYQRERTCIIVHKQESLTKENSLSQLIDLSEIIEVGLPSNIIAQRQQAATLLRNFFYNLTSKKGISGQKCSKKFTLTDYHQITAKN